jgi:hypothetical protein
LDGASSSDSIEFSAKYGSWVAVKRITIHGDTKPAEVAAHLASVRQSIDRKSFEILGIDTAKLDAFSESMKSKKSYSNLAQAIERMGSADAKKAIADACAGKPELTQIAGAYLIGKVIRSAGFDVEVNLKALEKAYPDLKLPKPPGRRKKE